jgi:glycosyltransferase involved in cell wall biosynthesis
VATLFHQRGYAVTVLELLSTGVLHQQLPATVTTIQLHRRSRLDLIAFVRLVLLLNEYDVIHIHMRHVYRYVFLANLFVKKRLILHDHFNQYPTGKVQRLYLGILLRHHHYIAVHESGFNWAIDTLHLKANAVHLLPNVVLKMGTEVLLRLNRLVLVSNIKPEKNIEFIVPLLQALTLRKEDIEIDVIGNVIDRDYLDSIVQKLNDFELSSRVTWRTDVTEVQRVLGSYSLGLHFSKRESGPLVLLEYIAQGLPFVSFLTGEVSLRIEADRPDFFMTNFDVDHWCDRILRQLVSSAYTSSLEELFEKHNDTEQYFQKCLRVYQSVHC